MDVLLMTDPIDEWAVAALPMYKDWKFVAITSDEAKKLLNNKASQDKQDEVASKEKEHKDFLSRVVTTVGADKLEAVRFTHSLGDTIGLLVTKDGDINPQMQQYLKAMGQSIPTQKRIMELNTDHPLVQRMMSLYQSDPQDSKLSDLISYTYDQAILNEG
jgi:molecular chaperone HtpG